MKFILWPNHRFLRYSLVFSLLLCISTIAISCSSTSSNESSESEQISSSNPSISNTLTVALLPWQSPEKQEEKLQPLAEYLETILKRPVNFQITKNYAEAVDLIVKEEVDMAYLAALTYIKANEGNPNIIAGDREHLTGNSGKSVSVVFDSSSVYVLIALAV
ncbi:PhnD/SsuA/transferrin family substrate-binding protein, partial [Hydrocoleum sp. CS-953]|uniref:PhnD/SsuA/transferrin family substrate-binding protein n=1 Tax=Hydrocoleum sp. CS-953 TaxID=1671698 RepID=UPI00143D81FB